MLNIDDILNLDISGLECEEFITPLDRCLRGQPLQRTWNLFTSPDECFFAGVWEAGPGCWRISYTEHEYCRILAGKSVLRDHSGAERVLEAGAEFLIPGGFQGEWDVLETTRKVYVIYQP